MGKANRQRRRAKLKDRERERRRRDNTRGERAASAPSAGPHGPGCTCGSQASGPPGRVPLRFAAERLIDLALDARRYETELFDGLLGQLAAARAPSWVAAGSGASSGEQSWPRIVSRELWSSLQRAARYGWQQGWQPAEAVRQVDRRFGARHARLAVDAVAGKMRSYAAAAVDERWQAQLTALRATAWWDPDDRYLEQWQARECLDWRPQ